MNEETKHLIAKQLIFSFKLLLLGWLILCIVELFSGRYYPITFSKFDSYVYNLGRMLFTGTCWLLAFIPVIIGLGIKLIKWVIKWK